MISSGPLAIVDKNGVRATGETTLVDGETRTRVRLADGRTLVVPAGTLQPRAADGVYLLPAAFEDFAADAGGGREEIVVPVVEERLQVEKRLEETGAGVRVRKVIREHEEAFDQPLLREHVDVERVTIGRMVDEPAQARQEGDTWIIPLMEEVLEVKKRFLLKEEVRITRRSETLNSPQAVTLRSEDVVIERFDREGTVRQTSAESAAQTMILSAPKSGIPAPPPTATP